MSFFSKEFEEKWEAMNRRHSEFKVEFDARRQRIERINAASREADRELQDMIEALAALRELDDTPRPRPTVIVEQIDEPEDYIDGEYETVTPTNRRLP